MYTKLYPDEISSRTNGTSLSGNIYTTYSELVKLFGEPTYHWPSDDGEVQKEWVFEDEDKNVFNIYDWKTYDWKYTMYKNEKWNVGSKGSPTDFILWVEERLRGVTNV